MEKKMIQAGDSGRWWPLGWGPQPEDKGNEARARMTDAYRGEGMSFEDDGSPEHDD